MPLKLSIESAISNYSTSFSREIFLLLSLDCFFSWYSDQKSSVLWNKSLSQKFSVSNDVRQGGVLSPILFIVYIDDLLTRLESQAVGCYWSHHFVGAIGHADDIVLSAPSDSALRIMLNTYCQFAKDHNLLFNANKT